MFDLQHFASVVLLGVIYLGLLVLSIGFLVKLWRTCNDLEESKVTQQLTLREIKLMNQNLQELMRELRAEAPQGKSQQP